MESKLFPNEVNSELYQWQNDFFWDQEFSNLNPNHFRILLKGRFRFSGPAVDFKILCFSKHTGDLLLLVWGAGGEGIAVLSITVLTGFDPSLSGCILSSLKKNSIVWGKFQLYGPLDEAWVWAVLLLEEWHWLGGVIVLLWIYSRLLGATYWIPDLSASNRPHPFWAPAPSCMRRWIIFALFTL